MKIAIANLQRQVFTLLLYLSSISGVACDVLKMENRSVVFAAWEALILFLVMFSLYYLPKGYGFIITLLLTAIALNFINSPVSLAISLNGIREIVSFLFLPIFYFKIFAEGNEEETRKYVNIVRKFCWFFLLLQLPVSFMQFVKYGASDMVGGTYGSMNGGNQTMIIICMVFFLFQFPRPAWQKMLLFFLLAPLMLNETKISFILIPMLAMFVFFEPKIKNVLLAGLGGALFLFLASHFYVHTQANVGDSLSDIFNKDFLNTYMLAYDEEHHDVPRVTRIIIAYNIISQQTFTYLFGMEYGMFRGTTSGAISSFAQNYNWLLSGTRPYIFVILLQGGLVMVAGIFLVVLRICNFLRDLSKQTIFYFIMFLVMLVYTDSFRWHNLLLVFMFFLFFVNSEFFKSKAYLNEDTDSFD